MNFHCCLLFICRARYQSHFVVGRVKTCYGGKRKFSGNSKNNFLWISMTGWMHLSVITLLFTLKNCTIEIKAKFSVLQCLMTILGDRKFWQQPHLSKFRKMNFDITCCDVEFWWFIAWAVFSSLCLFLNVANHESQLILTILCSFLIFEYMCAALVTPLRKTRAHFPIYDVTKRFTLYCFCYEIN